MRNAAIRCQPVVATKAVYQGNNYMQVGTTNSECQRAHGLLVLPTNFEFLSIQSTQPTGQTASTSTGQMDAGRKL